MLVMTIAYCEVIIPYHELSKPPMYRNKDHLSIYSVKKHFKSTYTVNQMTI